MDRGWKAASTDLNWFGVLEWGRIADCWSVVQKVEVVQTVQEVQEFK